MRYLSELEITQLAIGCIYVALERAAIFFPGTTSAAPSEWVILNRTNLSSIPIGSSAMFPFRVNWDIWEYVAVPVIQSSARESLVRSVRSPPTDWNLLVKTWEGLLREQLNPTVVTEEETVAVEETYPETDDLTWADGHPKLSYPIVR